MDANISGLSLISSRTGLLSELAFEKKLPFGPSRDVSDGLGRLPFHKWMRGYASATVFSGVEIKGHGILEAVS
jgi:hypothetical protein